MTETLYIFAGPQWPTMARGAYEAGFDCSFWTEGAAPTEFPEAQRVIIVDAGTNTPDPVEDFAIAMTHRSRAPVVVMSFYPPRVGNFVIADFVTYGVSHVR